MNDKSKVVVGIVVDFYLELIGKGSVWCGRNYGLVGGDWCCY